jgi:hypothetical protein
MTRLLLLISAFILVSCEQKKIKYSGLNDLFVGAEQIILYEDERFYLELGLGGTKGNYKINNDTVILTYDSKPSETWPDKLLIRPDYFQSTESDTSGQSKVKIKRDK